MININLHFIRRIPAGSASWKSSSASPSHTWNFTILFTGKTKPDNEVFHGSLMQLSISGPGTAAWHKEPDLQSSPSTHNCALLITETSWTLRGSQKPNQGVWAATPMAHLCDTLPVLPTPNRITELIRLEKTSEIIEPNPWLNRLNTILSTGPCHCVPRPVFP